MNRTDAAQVIATLSIELARLHERNAELEAASDRQAEELAARASAEVDGRFRSLFGNMLNGYACCQMIFRDNRPDDFVFLAVNTAFETLTGLREVVGRRASDVIPSIRETHPELFEAYGRVALGGKPERFEYQLKSLDMWLDVAVSGGEEHCFVVVLDDITRRKRAEDALHLQSAALRAAADSAVITDLDGRIEWVNPAFTAITGYSAEECIGKHHRDLVRSGKHPRAFFQEFWETILSGRAWRGEIINRRKDGTLYTELQAVTPILDSSGALTHFVAIQQDLTEHMKLEAQLRQAQKMEGVGRLASGIAHDFNNLLTVINGISELLLTQLPPGDPALADVEEIHRNGQRAAVLTRQLLAFSRQQVLEPRVLNIGAVVAETESLLRRALGEDVDLVVVSAPDIVNVKADRGQIDQVLTNLAVNARDAMPQGGRLTITVDNITIDEHAAQHHGERVPPGAYVRLVVGDSGVGMDESTREHIFEPFFTTKSAAHGTGLGLSTVFGIVKQSQGFIQVETEVALGTSFTIYLPQVAEAVRADRRLPVATSERSTEIILVVEDDAGLRTLIPRLLEPSGYTVLMAASGEDALRLMAGRESVDLLLSDVVMPGMSGRELAEQLTRAYRGIKVLYMSGYTSDTILRHGVLEAKMPFLNKPFTAASLGEKIREVLDSAA